MSRPAPIHPASVAFRRPRAAVVAPIALAILLGLAAPSSADEPADLRSRVEAAAASAYAAERTEAARWGNSTSPQALVQRARLLKAGLQVSPSNPLRIPHRDEAIGLLRRATQAPGEAGANAAAVLGAILVEDGNPAERDEAMALLRRAATAGDGGSAVRLADAILATRLGDPAAEVEARALYASALAKKEPGAAQGFAKLADDPEVASTYRRQAMMLLRLRSDRSGAAAFALAEAYRTGFGVAVDREAARRYFRSALSLGYGPAVAIFVSSGVASDEEVVEGLRDALIAGSKEAAIAIVRAFLNRSRIPVGGEDAAFAIGLLREIHNADAAIVEARLHLAARAPFDGGAAAAEAAVDQVIADGVAGPLNLLTYGRQLRDLPESPDGRRLALKLFLAGAERGEPLGAVHAVELLLGGTVAAPGDVRAHAMVLLEKAADAGDGRSLVLLADLYRDGDGVERSAARARDLYGRAIDVAREPAAYERLASMVLEGAYSLADVNRALELYSSAASAGSAAATAAIGRIRLSGHGEMQPDRAEGERLMQLAADNGYTPALVQLADFLRRTGEPADAARAADLYREAAASGEVRGTVGLAELAMERGDREAALALYREAADAGDAIAMVGLARLTIGAGGDGSTGAARQLLVAARETATKDSRAQLEIAAAALAFPDVETRATGLEMLVALAERGDSEARRRLVRAYVSGEAGVRDKDAALRWAMKALEDGTVEPAVILGDAMLAGDVPEFADPSLGRSLLERVLSVAPESVKALTRLGTAYAAGTGGPADPERALGLFTRAARLGSITAEIRVANAYLNGIGVERDPGAAYAWYLKAAEAGSRDAMVYLARMYASGGGASIDAEQSFVWFYRAASLGSVDAMQETGKALIAGYGTVKDAEEGRRWLEAAAAEESVGAMYDLFSYYSLAADDASFAEAMRWLRKAADNGSAAAMFRLAVLQRSDERLAPERAEAVDWLRRAAALGHKGSRRLLDSIDIETGATAGSARPGRGT